MLHLRAFPVNRPDARTRRKIVWGRMSRALGALLVCVCVASPAAAQVRVTAAWDPNLDALTIGYRVFIGLTPGTTAAQIDVGMQTSVPLDLPAGQTYFVSVRAYTITGTLGPPSAEVAVDLTAAPGAPSDFRASVNGSQATLAWGPPQGGGVPTAYLLSVGRSPGAADIVNGYPVGTGYSASGDLPQGRYYARLQASNPIGRGPYSPEISFEVSSSSGPLRPDGLSASWQGTVAVLSWSPPQGASGGNLPTSYLIEAGRASGASDLASFNVGNVTSYATDVPLGTYYVRVRGVNGLGVSSPSNEIVLQGRRDGPDPPTGLSSSGTGSSVTLRWRRPTTGTPPTGYVVEAGSAPGLSNLAVLTIGDQTIFATTAPPGTYYIRVRSVNALGTSGPSNEIVVRR